MPIATFIASEALNNAALSDASGRIRLTGCDVGDTTWLEPGKAADIHFSGEMAIARTALKPLEAVCDIVVQHAETRRKMLIVSDMDSTMITVECIDELADYAGIKPQIAEITERAMQGELDFSEALRARVKLLAGLDQRMIDTCLLERVHPMPGAKTLIKTMSAWGAHTVLVSGGFTHFAKAVGADIGFAHVMANVLGTLDGALTGMVEGAIVDAAAKRQLLLDTVTSHGIARELVLSVGDGANDIPMIEAAIEGGGMGASYHAKPKAEAAANFAIRHNDLTALLYAQGVPKTDWI
jgi:phosphoserine phosphatase